MPRNAAELRAAATATGLFNGPRRQYVGDGYSVPWEYIGAVNIPPGFTAFTYKRYLDANWIEFSRLHDWLYTPYGALINATQEEADDALQEELNTVSPTDAFIVGNACRYGGYLFWGKSTVGYFGEAGPIGSSNIGLAPQNIPILGVPSMPTKIVLLFQATTTPNRRAETLNYDPSARTSGWSESFYGPDDIAEVVRLLKDPSATRPFSLIQARANVMGASGSIIGARLYKGVTGKGQPLSVQMRGTNGASDSPQCAVQIVALSNVTGQSRRFTLRGMADDDFFKGEYDPDADDAGRMKQYFDALAGFGWNAKVETGKIGIHSINAAGVVTTVGSHTFGINNIVTLKNVYDLDDERRIGFKARITALPAVNQFTLDVWNAHTAKNGTVAVETQAFQAFATSTLSVARSVIRKVGRPFAGYRGRKSRKRKAPLA